MGLFDRIFGKKEPPPRVTPRRALDPDEEAVARYRYMLRTAPPDDIERAHAEAFSRLTPEQRRLLLQELSEDVPAAERPPTDSPQDLARTATRAEVREPGFMERTLNRPGYAAPMGGMGMGLGGALAGGLLAGVAGAFIGSSVAHHFFANSGHEEAFAAENGVDPDANYAYADQPTSEPSGFDQEGAYDQDPMGDPGFDDGGLDGFDGSDF